MQSKNWLVNKVKKMRNITTNIHVYVYEVISSKWSTFLRKNVIYVNSFVSRCLYALILATYIRHICICSILITLRGDIEKDLGSKPCSCDKFSICHCNRNSISTQYFIKVSLLRAYVSTHNFDILRSSETYLVSSISSKENNLTTRGYDLYIADHPFNVKRGGVCIYYKNFLPLKVISILPTRVHQLQNENWGKIMLTNL